MPENSVTLSPSVVVLNGWEVVRCNSSNFFLCIAGQDLGMTNDLNDEIGFNSGMMNSDVRPTKGFLCTRIATDSNVTQKTLC